jgi:hypothetical protein
MQDAGERVFHININEQRAVSNFDIVAAGRRSRPRRDRSFPVTVTDGKVVIELPPPWHFR